MLSWVEYLCLNPNTISPSVKFLSIEGEENFGELILPAFKSCYNAIVINTVWYCQKSRQIDQWNRIVSPEIDSYKYSQLAFDKRVKAI